jgi:predicted dehydrogenase
VPPSNRITLGFIGLGTEGRLKNLKKFMAIDGVQAVALCDVHGKRLHSAHLAMQTYAKEPSAQAVRGCFLTRDWREIIARQGVDAVVISTPDHWHVLPAIAAAKAGKDVFCEKPVSLTIREGRVLSDVIQQCGRIFQTGTEVHAPGSFYRACELTRNGRIGKLQTIRVEIHQGFTGNCSYANPAFRAMPAPDDFDYDMWLGQAPEAPYTRDRCHGTWRFILDYGGGNLADWGGHVHDVAQWGNGTDHSGPISVEGHGVFPQRGLFNAATDWELTFEYANGVRLISKSSRVCGVRFEGSDGWVQADFGGFEASSAAIAKAEIGPEETHLRTCAGFEHGDFIDCVRSRAETYAPAEVGHRSATISHLGNIALKLGRKLRWNPDTEQFAGDDEANQRLSRAMRSPWTLEA